MKSQSVSNIITGTVARPKSEFFEGLARHYPELNLRWLLLGEEPMLLSEEEGYVIREPDGPRYQNGDELKRMMRTIEQLTETIAQLSKLVNDVPALREEIEKMKKELEKLKKG